MSNNLKYSKDSAIHMKAYLLLLIAVIAIAGCSTEKMNTTPARLNLTDTPKTETVAIEINGFEISPREINIKYNDKVELLVLNNKNNTRFMIEDYIDDSIARNNEYHTSFVASKKGTFMIYVDGNERGQMIVN